MDLSLQKRLAADILNVGEDRVWIDPTKIDEVSKALTREDIRQLIDKGIIKKLSIKGQSRYWANLLKEKRKKGRRRGYGSRKGKKSARMGGKMVWVLKVRSQRKLIKILKEKGLIDKSTYRKLYLMIKSNRFRTKKLLIAWLKENKLLKQ